MRRAPARERSVRVRRRRSHFLTLLALLLLACTLPRPLYEGWSFLKVYWIRVKHAQPRPPPLCSPDTPPSVDLGLLPDYPAPSATVWRDVAAPGQTTALVAPRVAMVTLCDDALAALCAASLDNKRAYAQRHGYTLLHSHPVDPSRPTAWSKIAAVRAAFEQGFELVLCMDADALVMNPSVSVESLFDNSVDQVLAADHNGPNSGVWLIRDCAWSRAFLDALWQHGAAYVSMAPLRSIFRYEQRAFHYLYQSSAWRRRIGDVYADANGVRARTKLVHQCVLNSLASFYQPGDFVVHLAGIKGAVKCLLFRRRYLEACSAFGLTPGLDAVTPTTRLRCLVGSPTAGAPQALQWAYTALGDCVATERDKASFLLGLAAIFFALVAQVPQLLKNWRHRSTAALSKWLVLGWLLGDVSNLTGTLLTRQLPTQIAQAAYFVLMDSLLLCQYLAYEMLPRHRARNAARGAALCNVMVLSVAIADAAASTRTTTPLPACAYRREIPWRAGARVRVGYALGFVSAAAYVIAGVSQAAKNKRRRCVVGLSITMVLVLFAMNTCYVTSVALRLRSTEDVAAALPWLIAAGGPGLIDLVMLAQALRYCGTQPLEEEKPEDELAPVQSQTLWPAPYA